ncbi:MAG: tetratricopeptide repeat protein [Thermoanaerobaculia bacterium]
MRRQKPTLLLLALLFLAAPLAPARAAERSTAASEVAFAYGVRAYNHGDFAEAVRLFQEAVAADPDNREAREWLAAAQRRQSEAAAVAVPGFAGLLPLRDQPRFDLRLGADYGQDSNPLLINAWAGATIPGTGRTFTGEVGDHVADFDLRAAVYPFYGRGGWSLGLAGEAKAARFSDLDFLNERQWRAAAQLAWGTDPLGYLTGPLGYTRVPFGHSRVAFLLQAGTTDTRLDGDPLIRADEAALALVLRETVTTATQVEVDFQRRDLLDGRFKSDLTSLSASQVFFLGQRDRYLRAGGLWSQENKALEGDVSGLGESVELALPLSHRWAVQLAVSRREDKIDPLTGGDFKDITIRAAGSLSWGITRNLYLTGRATWTRRDSDFLRFGSFQERDYERTTTGLGIQWLF